MELPILGGVNMGWRDVLDITFITFVFYYAILLLKRTRAVAAVYGLVIILAAYVTSRAIGMNALNWLLEYVLSSLFLLVVIVFQRDIRQALTTIGSHRFFPFFQKKQAHPALPAVCAAAEYMAQHRIGALIVIERNGSIGDATERGVTLDARISQELLINIFWPNSPLHDGAVIIARNRIMAAGCILPLSTAVAKRDYGTRHRAALGITEETDAVVVVVSEERGAVAVSAAGKLTGPLDAATLPRVLETAMEKKI